MHENLQKVCDVHTLPRACARTHARLLTLSQMSSITLLRCCAAALAVAFSGRPRRRGIDKLTNSNWAITTPSAGIDRAVLGAGR